MNIDINWIAEFMTEDPDDFQEGLLDWGKKKLGIKSGLGKGTTTQKSWLSGDEKSPLSGKDYLEKRKQENLTGKGMLGKKDPTYLAAQQAKAEGGEAGEVEAGEVEAGEVEAGEVEAGEVEAGEGEDKKLSPPVERAANIIADTPGLEAALKSINNPDKLKQLVVAIMVSKQLAHLDKKTVFKGLKKTITDFGEVMREIGKTPEGGEAEGGEAEGGEAEGGEAEVEGGEVASSV
jgi:hypothetical protein